MSTLRQLAEVVRALPAWLLERFTAWAVRVSGEEPR